MKSTRVTSSFGLSVGTGLMFESLFISTTDRIDIERQPEKMINPDTYSKHYINLHTLIRNILSSFETADKKNFLMNSNFVSEMMDIISEEAEIINGLYDGTKCEPEFILPDYSEVFKKHANDYMVGIGDDNPVNKVIAKIKNDNSKLKLTGTSDNILITSHFTLDLMNYKQVPNLTLLESHTGRIKTKKEFNTKYKRFSKQDRTGLPFNERLLYIMGDGHMFKGEKPSIKKKIYELAISNNINFNTTDERLRFIFRNNDEELYNLYKTLHTFF